MNVQSILFPADFSKSSAAALQYASSLAKETGAKLHIVHVGDESTAYLAGYGGFAQVPDLPKQNRAALAETKPTVPDVDYETHYLSGIADREIVDFADRENVDLIVMGTHGRTGMSRLLMGSVAEGVLRRANCPVLTVKQPFGDSGEASEGAPADAESGRQSPRGPQTKLSLH